MSVVPVPAEPENMNLHPRLIWFVVFLAVVSLCTFLLVADRAGWLGQSDLFYMSDRLSRLDVRDLGDRMGVVFATDEGATTLTGEEFLREILERSSGRGSDPFVYQLFDITSWTGLLWVGLGLFAQVIFTSRMVLQWLSSEKAKRSVVPESFWWLSLVGATMLLSYFTWRRDIVGIVGQATGWAVYVRNLWLIHSADRRPTAPSSTPA